MTDPYRDLAGSFQRLMYAHTRAALAGAQAELGTITPTGGLKLDGFAHEIRDYLVSAALTLPQTLGPDSDGDTLATPEGLRALQPGDRVLVLLVNGGREHVVVARVVRHA